MGSKSRRIRKARVDPTARVARAIGVPECQIITGHFEIHDIANRSDADQRHMIRSGERRTVRRKPKLNQLFDRQIIDRQELAACEWYARAHALRYDTTGITANYGGAGGRSNVNFDHLPKTQEQWQAYDDFEYARAGINPFMLGLFERVVLHGRPLGKLTITFRTAARQLLNRIGDRVSL